MLRTAASNAERLQAQIELLVEADDEELVDLANLGRLEVALRELIQAAREVGFQGKGGKFASPAGIRESVGL
jgi:hypothetical protein